MVRQYEGNAARNGLKEYAVLQAELSLSLFPDSSRCISYVLMLCDQKAYRSRWDVSARPGARTVTRSYLDFGDESGGNNTVMCTDSYHELIRLLRRSVA